MKPEPLKDKRNCVDIPFTGVKDWFEYDDVKSAVEGYVGEFCVCNIVKHVNFVKRNKSGFQIYIGYTKKTQVMNKMICPDCKMMMSHYLIPQIKIWFLVLRRNRLTRICDSCGYKQ